jgi:hypothetical protein
MVEIKVHGVWLGLLIAMYAAMIVVIAIMSYVLIMVK